MKRKVFISATLLLFLGFSIHAQKFNDMIQLNKYASANKSLPSPQVAGKRVVFIGNSITEGWTGQDPEFFKTNNYVGRGISGQTSPQLLARFRQDVIALKPAAVVINIGTNDIAENTGVFDSGFTLGNIKSMAELAAAHGIKVILSSILPVYEYKWNLSIKDAPLKIAVLNAGIKEYAESNGFAYIDYYSSMHDSRLGLKEEFTPDGVHPNLAGYKVMESLAKAVIDDVLK
jgi:lysophospholipase L1-like esterase